MIFWLVVDDICRHGPTTQVTPYASVTILLMVMLLTSSNARCLIFVFLLVGQL